MFIPTDTASLHDLRRRGSRLYWQGFSTPQIVEMRQFRRPVWIGYAPTYRRARRRRLHAAGAGCACWGIINGKAQALPCRSGTHWLAGKYNAEYTGIDVSGSGVQQENRSKNGVQDAGFELANHLIQQ
ncbi:hypothetical protein J0B02_08750 [Enterobacteriaceae bacterium YMB-R22]|jgi:hypothetical protein|uniref:hypothetical protein n=1 Tax=Tenebrionicola larvae TaxID=2815733 RepID=UPI0037D9AB01|nr:hypothetical protein [Tenebrionicola larvae]